MNSQSNFPLLTYLNSMNYGLLPKAYKPDNFESSKSPKFSLTNIRGLRSNFADCESFLESNSLDILALCETNLDGSIDSGNVFVRGYLPLIQKDTHMHILALLSRSEGKTSFWNSLTYRKLC